MNEKWIGWNCPISCLVSWLFMTGFIQGHCWPGEVQQHHISLLQKCQGNSASLRYHEAGDLWRPAQMDENDRQGKQTVMQAGILWPLIFSFKISLDKMWHFCIVLVFPCYYYIICQTCQSELQLHPLHSYSHKTIPWILSCIWH